MVNRTVIITAGGIGKRIGKDIPKQFILLGQLPILAHTISVFHTFDPSIEILVTLPAEWIVYWKSSIKKIGFDIPHQIIAGGQERFHSIQNALRYATGKHIAVHDGVRPFVSIETIARCFLSLNDAKAVAPVLMIKDTIRKISEGTNQSANRSSFRLVHTPQCFHEKILRLAYKQDFSPSITDDATLVEQIGETICFVESNEENIKITTPFDLTIAQSFFLKK
jgi:2-C-methyl-D-erythritol 4-phosphate cytidylyltransferase